MEHPRHHLRHIDHSYFHDNQWRFVIDDNGDNFLTLKHCIEFLQSNYDIIELESRPAFWDIGYLKFKFEDHLLMLVFEEFGGTELRIDNCDINTKNKIQNVANTLIRNLRGKELTK